MDYSVLLAVLTGAAVLYFFLGAKAPPTVAAAEPPEPVLDKKAEKAAAKARASAERREKEKASAIARKKAHEQQLVAEEAASAEERASKSAANAAEKTTAAASAKIDTSPEALQTTLENAGFLQVLVSDGQGKKIDTNKSYDEVCRNSYGAFDAVGEVTDFIRVARSKKPSAPFAGASFVIEVRDKSVPGTIFTQGKNCKGTSKFAGVVTPKKVVMASYEFESGEKEEKQMELFRDLWAQLGKKK